MLVCSRKTDPFFDMLRSRSPSFLCTLLHLSRTLSPACPAGKFTFLLQNPASEPPGRGRCERPSSVLPWLKRQGPHFTGDHTTVEDRQVFNCSNILFNKNSNRKKKSSGNYKVEGLIMIKKIIEGIDR